MALTPEQEDALLQNPSPVALAPEVNTADPSSGIYTNPTDAYGRVIPTVAVNDKLPNLDSLRITVNAGRPLWAAPTKDVLAGEDAIGGSEDSAYRLSTPVIKPPFNQILQGKYDSPGYLAFVLSSETRAIHDLATGPRGLILPINPSDWRMEYPHRATVADTLTGGYLVSFGKGRGEISLSGVTGWKTPNGTNGPTTNFLDGYIAFVALRRFINDYYNFCGAYNPNDVTLRLFKNSPLDDGAWEIAILDFTATQSRTLPLLFTYELKLSVIKDLLLPWVSPMPVFSRNYTPYRYTLPSPPPETDPAPTDTTGDAPPPGDTPPGATDATATTAPVVPATAPAQVSSAGTKGVSDSDPSVAPSVAPSTITDFTQFYGNGSTDGSDSEYPATTTMDAVNALQASSNQNNSTTNDTGGYLPTSSESDTSSDSFTPGYTSGGIQYTFVSGVGLVPSDSLSTYVPEKSTGFKEN